MAAKNRAIVYCRVSSDRQAREEKTSLDDQQKRGEAKATELRLEVVRVQRDAESAWVLDKRSEFQRILSDARADTFDVLIVDRMNRFSRSEDITEAILVLRELRELGIRVEFCDRQYTDDVIGQMMMLVELGMSARDQEQRRKASRAGKVGRVVKHQHPLPGRRPPYGFEWVSTPDGVTPKTELVRDPGEAQAVVRRIWDYFLHFTPTERRPVPSVRGVKAALDNDHVPPPRVYQGIKPTGKAHKHPMRPAGWTHKTLVNMLRDPRYWGEAPHALLASKYQDEQPPVALPSYVRKGEAYVTPEEARRVHAMLRWNDEHAGRPPKRDWGLLLNGGIALCGYCGKRLDATDSRIPRAGSAPHSHDNYVYYKCSIRRDHGPDPAKGGCPGVRINADVLDHAAIATLDEQLARGDFLHELFATWERNEGAAADAVRIAKAALDEAEANIANLAEWAMRTPPDSPAGATLQRQLDEINSVLPGLRKRYVQAQADVEAVHANTALAQELATWFGAWLHGFWDLPIEWQRRFLTSINAHVAVWREDDPARVAPDGTRLPRAELRIGLPTDASVLPRFPLDIVTAAAELKDMAAFQVWQSTMEFAEDDDFRPETPEERAKREQKLQNMTVDEVMARVKDTMRADGLPVPRQLPGAKAASSIRRSRRPSIPGWSRSRRRR